MLYTKKDIVGGFSKTFYWSGTEFNSTEVWIEFFGTQVGSSGNVDHFSKSGDSNGSTYPVRAIRAF